MMGDTVAYFELRVITERYEAIPALDVLTERSFKYILFNIIYIMRNTVGITPTKDCAYCVGISFIWNYVQTLETQGTPLTSTS